MRKLFFGLPVSDEDGEYFRQHVVNCGDEFEQKARRTKPGNFHLTLQFIGYVKPEKVSDYIELGFDKMKSMPSFSLQFERIERFPHSHSLIIAAVPKMAVTLKELHQRLRTDNRPFRPHVTLCRAKPANFPHFEPIQIDHTIDFNEFVLYESIVNEKGSTYEKLQTYSLIK